MRRRDLLTLAAAAALAPAVARAQALEQPVRIVFPFAAAGIGDALARFLAEQLRGGLGRPVIVENRTGAAGRIGVQAVKAAAPDGATLLLTPIAPMAVYPHVYPALDYDPEADFAPVAQVASFEFGVAVNAATPVADVAALAAWVRADPARGSFGTPGAGTLPHFFGLLFAQAAGLSLEHVGYRGSAPAVSDLVGGHVPMLFTTTSDLLEMHRGGRIRILATSDAERSPFVPDIPTFREAGLAIEGAGWYGVYAPARTPAATVDRINAVIVAALRQPVLRDRVLAMGLKPTGTTPAEFAAIQRADSARWAPAVKASGFKPDL